jgi:hypothetical protein
MQILIIKENLGNCKYNLIYKIDFVEKYMENFYSFLNYSPSGFAYATALQPLLLLSSKPFFYLTNKDTN